MNISKLLLDLNERYPFIDAENWDNVGLQIGSLSKEIDKDRMFVALDVTSEVLDQLPENSVLVVHHPLFFKGTKSLEFSSYVGKMTEKIIKKDITLIVLHTNYDRHFLNRFFTENILGKEVTEEHEGLLFYEEEIVIDGRYMDDVKTELGLDRLGVVDCGKEISKVAVCTGSGSSMMKDAKMKGAGLLLTGDITHHAAIEAKEIGISLIDISHFGSEIYFGIDLIKDLGFKRVEQTNPIEER